MTADRIIPHPIYAAQGCAAIVKPDPPTEELVGSVIVDAAELARDRPDRRTR